GHVVGLFANRSSTTGTVITSCPRRWSCADTRPAALHPSGRTSRWRYVRDAVPCHSGNLACIAAPACSQIPCRAGHGFLRFCRRLTNVSGTINIQLEMSCELSRLASARLLRYERMSTSPTLTVLLGQAGDADLAEDFENRPIDVARHE